MLTISKLLGFVRLTHKFQQVKRAILVKGEKRQENDLEHSCQLALLAWYIVSTNNLKLNVSKLIQYSLAHDLVEIYAGDTNFYKQDKALKQKLEHMAVKRLQRELPEFTDLHTAIAAYEAQKDKESRFIYALDKVIPILNIYLDKGRTWKADGITLEMLIKFKSKPVSKSAEIEKYFQQLIQILKRNRSYFPK